MSSQRYYKVFGAVIGPISFEELKQLAAAGTIQPFDSIRAAESSDWVAATTIDELALSTSIRDRREPELEAGALVSAPANDWYCYVLEQELGPLSFDELLSYVKNQQLGADDEVKLGSGGKRRRVGSIGRLMAVLPQAPVENKVIPRPLERPLSKEIESNSTDAQHKHVREEVVASDVGLTDRVANTKAKSDNAEPMVAPVNAPKPLKPLARTPVEPVLSTADAGRHQNVLPEERGTSPSDIRDVEVEKQPVLTRESMPQLHSSSVPLKTPARGDRPDTSVLRRQTRSEPAWSIKFDWEIIERLNDSKFAQISAIVLVAPVIAGWQYMPRSHRDDVKRYYALKQVVDGIKEKRGGGPAELSSLQSRIESVAKGIAEELKGKVNPDEPAKRCLLWAASEDVRKFAQSGFASGCPAEQALEMRLQEVAYILRLEQRPPVVLAQNALPPRK